MRTKVGGSEQRLVSQHKFGLTGRHWWVCGCWKDWTKEDWKAFYRKVLNSFCHPFCPGNKGRRKARKTDASDLTPNPQKLHNIGEQLQKLNAAIDGMGPVNDLPAVARARSRKEKNKLASRYQTPLNCPPTSSAPSPSPGASLNRFVSHVWAFWELFSVCELKI